MLELFTDKRNLMISKSYTMMSAAIYDQTSAMLWLYFAVVAVIMGIAVGLYTKCLLKKWE